jgi:hypothetical protein
VCVLLRACVAVCVSLCISMGMMCVCVAACVCCCVCFPVYQCGDDVCVCVALCCCVLHFCVAFLCCIFVLHFLPVSHRLCAGVIALNIGDNLLVYNDAIGGGVNTFYIYIK